MSIGLPAHLAPQAVRRSFVTAQHTVAFTLLTIAALSTLVLQGARPGDTVWPAALALLPSMALLLLRNTMKTELWCLAYLLVTGIGIHLHALILLSGPIAISEGDGFSFLAVKVALIMIGGSVMGILAGLAWAVAGYIVAELAIGLAQVETGQQLHLDYATAVALAGTLIIIPLIAFNSRRQSRAQPRLHRAAQDEQVAELRYRIEVKAAALMHDTVLNHLSAIAESATDQLEPVLRELVERDVNSMMSEEWLADPPTSAHRQARLDWQHSGLFSAIQESRLLGLDVDATGDLAAVGRLERDASVALGLAVKQCLVNVLKHSGTQHAEVAVYGSEDSVSVMVVDNGVGFTEAATGVDRLGLKSSVRKRIELLDGHVNVWSTPGRGTSIMIKVPVEPVRLNGIAAGNGAEP